MFSKFVVVGVGMACAVVACAAPRLGASPISVKFGTALRWSHAKLRVKTTSVAHWKAGLVIPRAGFSRRGPWSRDTETPPGGSLLGFLWESDAIFDGRLGAPSLSDDLAGGNTLVGNVADVATPMDEQMRSFMRTLTYPRVFRFCTDVVGDGIIRNPIELNTARLKAEWLFGLDRAENVNDGVVVPSGALSLESSHTQDLEFNRPAVDLNVQVAFELNPYISLFIEGAYGFVFGKPIEKKDINLTAVAQKDEVKKTLLGRDMTIRGGLGFLGFVNSAGRMFTGVKTEVSLKEGWKAFAGFNYTPDPSLFVSFGVGLKEYRIAVDVTRETFHYPYSDLYNVNIAGTDAFNVKPTVKLHFEKNIFPLVLRAMFGAIIKNMHVFAIGVEYVSTRADLNASAKSLDTASATGKNNKDKKDRAFYNEEFALPVTLLGDDVTTDDMQERDPVMHMTDPDKVVVKHSTQIELTDISLTLSYQLKL